MDCQSEATGMHRIPWEQEGRGVPYAVNAKEQIKGKWPADGQRGHKGDTKGT